MGPPLAINLKNTNLTYVSFLEGARSALDVYSWGLAIEPLRESMGKLSYGNIKYFLIENLENIN